MVRLKGYLVAVLLFLNTAFWCFPLYLAAFLKWVSPLPIINKVFEKTIVWVSKQWVGVNSMLSERVQHVKIEILGAESLKLTKSYMIVANHQSWVDILVLQRVFHNRTPFLRFFVKDQLKWLPLLGPAFKALNFPFMKRFSKDYLKKHPERAGDDIKETQENCRKLKGAPVAMINFLEGTRFTLEKYKLSQSPFKNLLTPKAGGLAYTLAAFEGRLSSLLDVTIVYPKRDLSFWTYISGQLPKVKVYIRELKIPEKFQNLQYSKDSHAREEFQKWVNQVWQEKDLCLDNLIPTMQTQ